jgi:hypothetical protein
MWAVGVLTYNLLCGKPLFEGKTDKEINVMKLTADSSTIISKIQGSDWSHISDVA